MQGSTPWRGYADVKPMAAQVITHYENIRKGYKEQQRKELDNQLEQVKLRPDFGDLETDKQQEVLQRIRKVFVDVDEAAVQPPLLLIKQTPDRIREAAAEAHRLMDQLINEAATNGDSADPDDPPKPRVHIIRLNLRNKIISDKDELELVLFRLKEECLKELEAGIKVRFEE
jgi:hypothetical protein